MLKRFGEREGPRDIVEDRWTVSEKIEELRAWAARQPVLRFAELFATTTSRSEVVVTFLALLELMRLRLVRAVQQEAFGEIEIHAIPTEAAAVPEAVAVPSTPAAEAPATVLDPQST